MNNMSECEYHSYRGEHDEGACLEVYLKVKDRVHGNRE